MIIKIDFIKIENIKTKPQTKEDLVSLWKQFAKAHIEKRILHYKNVFVLHSLKQFLVGKP